MTDAVSIRPARPGKAADLSALAQASKAAWAYSPAQLEVFRAELTLRPDELGAARAHVLTDAADKPLGFYTFEQREDGRLELSHLFVAPDRLREGLGARLLENIPSSIPGRTIPLLELSCDAACQASERD